MQDVLIKGRKILSGSYANINYETREYLGKHIHIMTAVGPLDRGHRIPVYDLTVKNNASPDYFVILDNHRCYEDHFSYGDMQAVADIMTKAGIKRVHGAIITRDSGYENLMKLSRAVARLNSLESKTVYSEDMKDAESFILSCINHSLES